MMSHVPSSGDETVSQFRQFIVAGLVVPLAALVLIISFLRFTGTVLERGEWKQVAAALWIGGILALVFAAVSVFRARPQSGRKIHRPFERKTERTFLSTGNIFALFFIPACAFAFLQIAEQFSDFKLDREQWRVAVSVIWIGTILKVFWSAMRKPRKDHTVDRA